MTQPTFDSAGAAPPHERHPRGLYVLFATEMWERFSFYSMLAMFTLYLQDPDEGFGWTKPEATTLYSNYAMFVYASLGIMMGGWFVATAIGNKLTVIGVFWTEWLHSTFWAVLAGLAFAIAVVLLVLLRPLKRAMPGV
jgi:dipeptide/tripeptide permease